MRRLLLVLVLALSLVTVASASVINGTSARDEIYGTWNPDTIDGRAGNDWLFGDPSPRYGVYSCNPTYGCYDTIYGGPGWDWLNGGENGDTLYARGGSAVGSLDSDQDTLIGEGGPDSLLAANTQSDNIYCGAGLDTVYYDQRDTLNGCAGDILNYRPQ